MKKSLFFMVALMIATQSASAQVTLNVETDMAGGSISVSGKCDVPGDYVYLQVLRPGKTPQTTENSNLYESLYYTDDTFANENGEYLIDFDASDASGGDYVFRVRAYSGNEITEKTVNIVSAEEINSILDTINNAESANDRALEKLFNDELIYSVLALDAELYNMATDRTVVCKNVYEEKEKSAYTTDRLAELKELIRESLVVSVVNLHSKSSALIMDRYKDEISYRGDLSADTVYDEVMNGEQQADMLSSVGNGKLRSYEELCAGYPQDVLFYAVKNCRWQFLENIADAYEQKLEGIELSDYKKLKDTHAAAKNIMGKDYESYEDFVKTFNKAVKNQQDNEKSSKSSGGGGGGGGSSGRQLAEVPEPIPVVVEKPETVEFGDIDTVPWAADAIKSLASKNVINGVAKGVFAPDRSITREEFVKIFVGAFEMYQENAVCNFDDVEKTAWYYPYVATACNAGIISGTGNNLFGTGQNITRKDVCLIVYRLLKDTLPVKYSEDMKTDFSDITALEPECAEAITALANNGIVSGMGNGLFAPDETMTRAQASVLLYNAMK